MLRLTFARMGFSEGSKASSVMLNSVMRTGRMRCVLHTKSVTVDGTHSLFGSVNLDPRSMRLNFEILLAVYNADFTSRLRALQQEYIDQSQLLDLETYQSRPWLQQTAENFARLLSPLL